MGWTSKHHQSIISCDGPHGKWQCHAVVLLQKDASLELLLGTDVLTQLGFYLLEASEPNGPAMKLLEGHTWQDPSAGSASSLHVDAPVFAPVTPMVIPVMDLYWKRLILRKPKELSR